MAILTRQVRYEYNTGLDTTISRVSFIADSDLAPHYEEYSYLGASTIVIRKRPQPNYDLSYFKLAAEPVADAGDQYTGLDRFGRIVDQRWIRTSNASHRDRFKYGYDRLHNPLYKENLINTAKSELFHLSGAPSNTSYDLLSRMTEHHIGTLGAGKDTITDTDPNTPDPVYGAQIFSLDALGNWTTVTQDGTAQTRTHNSQNQITSVSGGAFTPTYDSNGNLTRDHTGRQFVFDAWNSLK